MSDSGSETHSWSKIPGCSTWVGAGLTLAVAHLIYASAVGMEIFRRRGGFTDIGDGWTAIGGVERSWTPVAWLPAAVLFFVADWLNVLVFASGGLILVLCGSIAAGVTTVQALRILVAATEVRFGRFAWRLWLLVLLWVGWLPVPFEMTLTYWHTVRY